MNINQIYSKEIFNYAYQELNQIIIPDLVMKKESVACGDYIVFSGEIDNNILRFNCICIDSCILSRAMCNYININYNHQNINDIQKNVEEFYKNIITNRKTVFDIFNLDIRQYSHRFDCLFSPVKLFFNFVTEILHSTDEYYERENTINTLDCDACVGMCKINWNNVIPSKFTKKKEMSYSNSLAEKWLPYAKINLNNSEKQNLINICKSITKDEFQFLSDRTINTFVLQNLLSLSHNEELNSNWKAAAYLIQKNEITKFHIKKIENFIINKALEIYFVKGYVTQKYYKNPNLRIHSDYDLVSTNCEDAFILTNYLLQNGFRIRPTLFSYKKIFQNKEEIISGHFHLQKIIDDTYMLEIDISFPGFLLNRINLYYPDFSGTNISVEDQLIITLIHLFKHSHVFMKDINDIYYMINYGDYNIDILKNKLENNQLMNYFSLAIMFIYNNYGFNTNKIENLINQLKINKKIFLDYPNWPYDEQMHIKAKSKDYALRISNSNEIDRCFLYPVVMFKDYIDLSKLDLKNSNYSCEHINSSILKLSIEKVIFYVTSIGIFIEEQFNSKYVSRITLINSITEFMKTFNINNIFDIPYSTESFYVRVI